MTRRKSADEMRRRVTVPLEERKHFTITADVGRELYVKLSILAADVHASMGSFAVRLIQEAWNNEEMRGQVLDELRAADQQKQETMKLAFDEKAKANGYVSIETRLSLLEEKIEALVRLWE